MTKNLLATISNPSDLRKLSSEQLPQLAKELRAFIIDIVATKEGHLGASLGVVELTIALHYLFDTPNDLLVWDVGHQAYGHKILTGRKDVFHTNRQQHGVSGFPKRNESEFDAFGVGHSSTSISAALGMAIASNLKGETEKHHIAVIGDASIASGMAFEALNHAGVSNANLLIILNDNAIGIDPSVGALKEYLTKVKTDKTLAKNNIIRALNFDYSGPIDGHNIDKLSAELQRLKRKKGPKFLHIVTTKGKGLQKAEEDQVRYHSPGKFDKVSGEIFPKSEENQPAKYQDVFGDTLVELAAKNKNIVAITPAMLTGSSLNVMMQTFPDRTFDVGIAEQHAVTLAAGLATQKMIPFCVIYSTFLQRAYDQVIHDVALQKLPVIFCIDRAGLVGRDGATHHGVFDIAYLNCIPNLIICAPRNEVELRNILYTAQLGLVQPIAIRYPRGKGSIIDWKQPFSSIEIGTGTCLQEGSEIAVLSIGSISNNITKAIEITGQSACIGHYDMRFVKPLDEHLLHTIFKKFEMVITVEDGTVKGGFGTTVLAFASTHHYKNTIKVLGVPDQFVEHGDTLELQQEIGLDPLSLSKEFIKHLS
ncbi:1-deoxy-D-xylulose-5-phosphate synthase [Flavobacteriaceae bacterium S356]|uniref:1-deoxy-D-xylulose-5-phosphate synthase n=1 Tax=Asprobacillus argus TaxID=3076534 RepID=A0ABU3LCY9_9FLAO|nr:1-deoxy-D-xylulose-5-phosphate synthase [Flavobacteriaceae bacterium S356]